MTLSALIRRGGLQQLATAIPAIAATEARRCIGTVAEIAAVAVADCQNDRSSDRDIFEERAAIMEFDGGLSRYEAERLAAASLGLRFGKASEGMKHGD